MKVLQINKYHYIKGGTETVLFNTINLLQEYGHEVYQFSLKDKRNIQNNDEKYFVEYPEMSEVGFVQKLKNCFSFFYNRDAKRKIERLIKDKQPDIAHIHLLFNGISVSILPVLKKYNIPVVMTVHDYRLICPSYLFLDGKNKVCERCKTGNYFHCVVNKCHNASLLSSTMLTVDMYFRRYFIPVTKYIQQFIFVSEFTYSKHSSYDSILKKKGNVLPNFVNIESGVQGEDSVSEKYYLYYGRLSREKGLETLLDVAKQLNINLKIAGTGPLLKKKEEYLSSTIEFLGFKSGGELKKLIQDAYFVIVPSEWYETFGLTVIEPQVLGTPVIGAKIGAIPGLIEDGKNGFLFESGNVNALCAVINKTKALSEEMYSEMCCSAKKYSKPYSDTSSYYSKLMGIYQKAIVELEK